MVLKFAGVENISEAEQLVGLELQIPREARTELEAGAAYVSEIVGCEVWVTSAGGERHLLGIVKEVRFGAGEAPLLVVRCRPSVASETGHGESDEQELLVPYAEEFLKAADFEAGRIEMRLPEGLLELEAPLSAEEKQRQKSEADETRAAGVMRKPKR